MSESVMFSPVAGVIYIDRDGDVFVSPDGVGRVYYESVEHARSEIGRDTLAVHLTKHSDDY